MQAKVHQTSVSSSSICTQLASLTDLHEGINNLIQLRSVQQALTGENWASELLDRSLKLVDICGIVCDVIYLTKESVQELQSSLRRNRDMNEYINSRKKINKMVKKCIKILKSSYLCSTELLNKDNNLKAIVSMVKEAQTHEEKNAEEWYALNIHKLQKDMDTVSVQNILKQLNASEMTIQELEENLESFFRSIVKTRVSLLTVLNNLSFTDKAHIKESDNIIDDFRLFSYKFSRFLKNGFLLLARVIAMTICVTLAASMAAKLRPTPMAAFQICLQLSSSKFGEINSQYVSKEKPCEPSTY
ncbi:unnamed protein product [Fraxinus pennsylvanica]|uniref:Uncharacterized protein n=1 Tax=Fraxinus pennsylvanica TaxID=56036 RepID=A0AAD2A3K0_9LAMI|nr:unnamed protein product [Fraxinus pennsylvanica]